MPQPVIMVIGVAGSGKTWVCKQLADKFAYIPHDCCWRHPSTKPADLPEAAWGPPGSKSTHWETLVLAAHKKTKAVITEVPFGETRLRERLEAADIKTVPVFVVEDDAVIKSRFSLREGRRPDEGVLTRARNMKTKAEQWEAYAGTSDQVLEYLKKEKL